jgi:hypothetical protein
MTGRGATSQLGYFMDLLPLYPNVEDYKGRTGLSPPTAYLYKSWGKETFKCNL